MTRVYSIHIVLREVAWLAHQSFGLSQAEVPDRVHFRRCRAQLGYRLIFDITLPLPPGAVTVSISLNWR